MNWGKSERGCASMVRLGGGLGLSGKEEFRLPVDSEHKANVFRPWTVRGVHMRSFHASWMSFFVSFLSTFAPAALLPIIREDVDLTTNDIGAAGIAAVTGVISARVLMGALCDTVGPRYGHAGTMLLTAPAVFGMTLITNGAEFVICRFLIGFSIATFVACQYWSSVMFNVKIVAKANATGAGWGNAGGGVAQLLMPVLYKALTGSYQPFLAWRLTMFIPGILHIVIAFVVLTFAQDMPDGTFFKLRSKGIMAKANVLLTTKAGLQNWRTWLMTLLYGLSFGVELTIQNIVVIYFFDTFHVSLRIAGIYASVFGLLNLFARSIGGIVSDYFANEHGMRGRLFSFWLLQTLEGLLCAFVGLAVNSLALTVVLMAVFSIFVQASEGACYGIVPFVSKRALGVVTGLVGAGGNAGSAVLQTLFFRTEDIDHHLGFIYTGIVVMIMGQLIFFVSFPQWGGILIRPNLRVTEEDYYLRDFTEDEVAQGLANAALVFAEEAKTQRGQRRIARERETAAMKATSVSIGDSSPGQVQISKISSGMVY